MSQDTTADHVLHILEREVAYLEGELERTAGEIERALASLNRSRKYAEDVRHRQVQIQNEILARKASA